jgi:hypothetical protein
MRHLLVAGFIMTSVAGTAAEKAEPVNVHLEAIDGTVVQGFPVDEVEKALRDRLARIKEIRLVPEPEEARVVLKVTECLGWSEKRRVDEAGDRPILGPTGDGGVARGTEGAYGVRTETRPQISLVVRATWAEHFTDLQSATDEKQLKGAVDTVASQLAGIVKRGLKLR